MPARPLEDLPVGSCTVTDGAPMPGLNAGDSMEPTAGALVVVDKDRRVAVAEQVFVVRIGEALMVKRFRQVGDQWNLVSDSSAAHLPRPMTAADRIVGRVAWCGPHSAPAVV